MSLDKVEMTWRLANTTLLAIAESLLFAHSASLNAHLRTRKRKVWAGCLCSEPLGYSFGRQCVLLYKTDTRRLFTSLILSGGNEQKALKL